MTELDNVDVYKLLNIEENASLTLIRQAYRKTSLKYHPDKNSSADAVEKFHLLGKALELLTDAQARAKYDQKRAFKKQAESRRANKNAERLKLQEELERREANAAKNRTRRANVDMKAQEIRESNKTKKKLHEENNNFNGKKGKSGEKNRRTHQNVNGRNLRTHWIDNFHPKEDSFDWRTIEVDFSCIFESQEEETDESYARAKLSLFKNIFKKLYCEDSGRSPHVSFSARVSSDGEIIKTAKLEFSGAKAAVKMLKNRIESTSVIEILSVKYLGNNKIVFPDIAERRQFSAYHATTLQRLLARARARAKSRT